MKIVKEYIAPFSFPMELENEGTLCVSDKIQDIENPTLNEEIEW